MKRPFLSLNFSLFVLIAVMSSCSEYQHVLKSNNPDKKYEMAVKCYQKKDYFRASTLLEEMLPIVRGTKKAERVFYYYAYSQFGLGEYLMAAYHFENFVKTFPNSDYTEECMYMSAYCYYKDSPSFSLDQTNTYKAINQIQLFIDRYPHSARVNESNELMDKLRAKLETKAFENSKLYFNMENYKSAISAYKNLLKDFPDSKYREESMYMICRSWYLLGHNSIESKKLERMQSTVEAYNAYIDAFPSGKFIKDAQTIFDNSLRQIDKLKKANS